MQINKQKTKEMIITTSRTASVPLYPDIQQVETFKLLGIVVSNDLKWNPHIAYIIHKANSRLHFLRQLKPAAVPHHDMLHFYTAVIGLVLEYAVPVWHTGLTADISDQLETVNKGLANAKRPCDCRVLCLRLKSSMCSCAHSISDMTSFRCRDQGRDSVCPVL